MWLLVTCYVGMAMCKILNPHMFFVDIFPWLPFPGAGGQIGTIFSWHNGTCPYVPHYMIMILIASFDISYPNLFISPEYYFDSIVFSSFYRLFATYFLFVPCSQKYTYLPVCICSPLLTYSPNAPHLSSQCAPGMGHIGTVEIHFSKVLTPTIFAQ